jgi:hypothetical protein
MTPYHAGAPMERVHLDFMGHLPKTKKGNEYVLMMVEVSVHPNFPGSYPQNILLHPSSFYSAFPPDH